MSFVRKRETKAGAISTALVEAYRDKQGRPRQRVLANLHGAETALDALARLVAQRQELRKERAELAPEVKSAEEVYKIVMTSTVAGHKYSKDERKDIDHLLRARKKLLKRSDRVEALLVQIEREGAIIKKHCDASPGEIQAAIKAFQKQLAEAEMLMLGAEFGLLRAKSRLRQLSAIEPATSAEGEVRQLSKVLGI